MSGRARPPVAARASAVAAFEAAAGGPPALGPEALRAADGPARRARSRGAGRRTGCSRSATSAPWPGTRGAEALAREAGRLGGARAEGGGGEQAVGAVV
jgi:hypothetical protein